MELVPPTVLLGLKPYTGQVFAAAKGLPQSTCMRAIDKVRSAQGRQWCQQPHSVSYSAGTTTQQSAAPPHQRDAL